MANLLVLVLVIVMECLVCRVRKCLIRGHMSAQQEILKPEFQTIHHLHNFMYNVIIQIIAFKNAMKLICYKFYKFIII